MLSDLKGKCLSRLKKIYCRLQISQIHGIGVFAIRDIPKGASVFYGSPRQNWLLFNKKELSELDQEVKKMIDDFLPTSDPNTILVPENGLNAIDISFYLNHSKKPNCRGVKNGSFVATRDIKKGEELTADYATYDFSFKESKKFKNLNL